MPTEKTDHITHRNGENNNAKTTRCNFAFWNISHAANGQDRQECVKAIIKLIMTNYKPVCFGIGEYQKKESSGISSLDYHPPKGYSLITSHAIGPEPNNTDPVALIYKNDIFGGNNSNIVKTGGNERSVTLKNAIISGIDITISTFHYPVLNKNIKCRNPSAYLSSIAPDGSNSYNNVIAFGDWNATIVTSATDTSATKLIHSRSDSPPPVFLQREITYKDNTGTETLEISPPLKKTGSPGVEYTRIIKNNDKDGKYDGTYTPGKWLDVFFLKHDKVKAVTLTHLTYSGDLIKEQAFGKSKSNGSKYSVAPSDHLPIIIEVEFNS